MTTTTCRNTNLMSSKGICVAHGLLLESGILVFAYRQNQNYPTLASFLFGNAFLVLPWSLVLLYTRHDLPKIVPLSLAICLSVGASVVPPGNIAMAWFPVLLVAGSAALGFAGVVLRFLSVGRRKGRGSL